jgi:RND superfamily putative drug exporter
VVSTESRQWQHRLHVGVSNDVVLQVNPHSTCYLSHESFGDEPLELFADVAGDIHISMRVSAADSTSYDVTEITQSGDEIHHSLAVTADAHASYRDLLTRQTHSRQPTPDVIAPIPADLIDADNAELVAQDYPPRPPEDAAPTTARQLGTSRVSADNNPVRRMNWHVVRRPKSSTEPPLVASPGQEAPVVLRAIARLALAAPRRIIAVALLVMVGTAIFGIPIVKSLPPGGFTDPTAESSRASRQLSEKFGQGDMRMIITVTSDAGVHSQAARAAGAHLVDQLTSLPFVAQVTSAWTAPPQVATALISKDGKTGLIVAGITGGESGAQRHAGTLTNLVHDFDGVTVKAGGEVMESVQLIDQTKKDVLVMEAIALPLSFVVLVWVFGGLLAAALPLAVGVFAILGSMAVMRAITFATEVSVFTLNLVLALGLALAIDYTLLIVSRFRDELADGARRDEALARTMASTGRTVLFSAITVALSMMALALFPMYFLKSLAIAGIAVVAFTAVASLVVTPAAIVLLGERLDSLDVRHFVRRVLGRPEPVRRPVEELFWYRWTRAAMRWPIPIGLAIIALLLVLGAPFLGVKLGSHDDRVLPGSASARQVGDELRTGFAFNSLADVVVVVPDAARLAPSEFSRYAAKLSLVADVSSVSSPSSTFIGGRLAGPPSATSGLKDGSALLTVNSTAPMYSQASEAQLDQLHAVATPGGRDVQMTGLAQINRDSSTAVNSRLPLVLTVIAVITFLLLFLLTGSVVLPLKALLLNVMSLTATFGALVWIFQDGHLGGFGTTATGTMAATVPVVLFCLAFGLSMDYEVFLISRIRESWLVSGKTRADNDESVALGLARTGPVVTAAALLMALTFASLISANVSVTRMFGIGVPLAVLVDATLVRMLLMPALMRVLGRVNWWAPRPLARLHQRFGTNKPADLWETSWPETRTAGRVVRGRRLNPTSR